MSQENVEIVRQLIDAVDRQDLPRLLALTDPEVEWQSFFAPLHEGGIYRGHDGIREYMDDLVDTAEVHVEIEDTLTVGNTTVIVGQLRYRGRSSGVETETTAAYVVKTRAGKVVLLRALSEPEAALERLGSE